MSAARKIAFSPPDIREADIESVNAVLRSGWITTGPVTKEFERALSAYCGTTHTACLNSAVASMVLTLRYLGIGAGDEVITSAYTFTASAGAICHVGATPVLMDTAPDSYEMDYGKVEAAINKKTKAIIPVDIAGIPCDYDRITNIMESKRNLFHPRNHPQETIGRVAVLADAAHSLGAEYKGKKSAGLADFTCFSFHAVKNLTTGEGGAVTWRGMDDTAAAALYRHYMLNSMHGQTKDAFTKMNGSWEYDVEYAACKCNMGDMAAALGLSQLARYEDTMTRRHEIIRMYDGLLGHLPLRFPVHVSENHKSSGHLYMLRMEGRSESFRNDLLGAMSAQGVSCNVHFKPLPLLRAYKDRGFDIKDFPNAHAQYANEVTLPLNNLLTDEDVEYVAECFVSAFNGGSKTC